MSGYKVAIAGATGNVGREMLSILAERRFPVSEVVALASSRSIGKEVSFGDKTSEVQVARPLRLFRHRHLPHVRRRRRVQGMVAQDRGQGLRRDRQFLRLAHGPGGAARGARGQRRRGSGICREVHHREPELLHRSARRGAQAAARPRDHQARGGGDLSVRLGGRQGGDGRALLPDPRGVHQQSGRDEDIPQAHRVQPHSSDRRLHG